MVVYTAQGCRLCERALEVVHAARAELAFELEVVDIGGESELERRYREHLPVVEIDGERAFTYFVPPEALGARLRAARDARAGAGRRPGDGSPAAGGSPLAES